MLAFSKYIYIFFVASLPFISLNVPVVGLSPPVLLLLLLSVSSFILIIIEGNFPNVLGLLDVVILFYLVICLVTLYYSEQGGAVFAAVKSWIYFCSYICLKLLLARFSFENVIKYTLNGIVLGLISFASILLYLIILKGITIHGFSYWGGTFVLMEEFINLFPNNEDVVGRDVKRNSLGEVFVFFTIFIAVVASGLGRINRVVLILNSMLLVLFTFSRRALFSIVFTQLIFPTKALYINFVKVLMVIAICLLYFGNADTRYVDLTDQYRSQQYQEVFDKISNHPFSGYGYGEKDNYGKYVHNFVLSSFYMGGVFALIVSVLLFGYLVSLLFHSFYSKEKYISSYLLIIPVMGMLVGSTVEGLFTLIGWLSIAMFELEKNSLRGRYE